MADRDIMMQRRQSAVRTFVRATFGVRGTLRLHRSALGADLLRAPVNVMLAPVFLVTRLVALLARFLRFNRVANTILRWKVLFRTNVAYRVSERVKAFLSELDEMGIGPEASTDITDRAVEDYAAIRNAVAEITTTLIVLLIGYLLFRSATPGVISLATPVAEMRARSLAIEQFPLGDGLGSLYYGVFSTNLALWQVILTGVILAMLASVITTFAGILADPLQVLSGMHRRRLLRLMDRLEKDGQSDSGLAGEHLAARLADITDIFLNIWRSFRG
ncbi:DUF6635 family protein [Actibacterium sp. 188UL27-1]|uniref:DUF6635 family protein n=1 Tax=Actibacterium sp. 188UL27-1 TaxID=2786961 RepID=UPI0019583E13|nr:DUF6635 family protein [Actibacterium sp. 188UL27-1]MBM7067287.1 hypothetical protein [Actibacterium sp. 188UL27-1]